MNRKMTEADYVERYGRAFVDAVWDSTLSYTKIAKEFGVPHGTVFHIRETIVPKELRQTRRKFMTNPAFVQALKSKASTKEIALRFDCHCSFVNRCRIKVRGRVVKPPIKLTEQVIALLRSSLSNGSVARALDTTSSVVTEHRKALGVPIRFMRRVSPEERQQIIAIGSPKPASLVTGIPYATCRDVLRLHNNLPRR